MVNENAGPVGGAFSDESGFITYANVQNTSHSAAEHRPSLVNPRRIVSDWEFILRSWHSARARASGLSLCCGLFAIIRAQPR